MNSKSYFDLKFFFLSFLCLILPLSVLAAHDPAEFLTGGPAPDPQFSDDCESSLIGGTDFTSVTQQNVYSYYITDIDYIETGENQYDDSGIVIASAFEHDYNNGNFHPELGGGLYQADVYTIVSNPKVLREEYTRREDGVNRLIFALYSEVLDTQGALKLLFSYNIQGLRPGSDVKVEMDIEDLYSDCGPASNGILQLQVDMVSEGVTNSYFPGNPGYEFGADGAAKTFSFEKQNLPGSNLSVKVYARNWPSCKPVAFSKIRIYGCYEKDIVPKNGENFGFDGENVTLVAQGLEGYSGDYMWERSYDGGLTWETIDGETGREISAGLVFGENMFRVTRAGESADAVISGIVNCAENSEYDESSGKILFKEDFGTKMPGRYNDENVEKVGNFAFAQTGKVDDGFYCVVSNLSHAEPGMCDWPGLDGSKTDHTGNPNGGFLVVNAKQQNNQETLIYECDLEQTLCGGARYTMSLYAANVARFPNMPGEFRFAVVDEDGNTIGDWETGPIIGMSEDGEPFKWHRYGFTFSPSENTNAKLRIYDTAGQAEGNDFAIDDILVTICEPDVTLYADYANGNIDFSGDCGDPRTLNAVTVGDITNIFPNPYYLWQSSSDDARTWTTVERGAGKDEMEVSQRGGSDLLYRVIIAENEASAEAAAQGEESECSSFVISNNARITCEGGCELLPEVSIESSDNDYCPGTEGPLSLTATVTNSAEVSFYLWEKSDAASGGWQEIEEISSNGRTNTITVSPRPAENTVFRVTAGDSDCTSSAQIEIRMRPASTAADVSASGMSVCPGSDAQLSASSGLAGVTYTWYADEELTQQAGTGQQLSLTDVQSPATYYVTVQNDEYCETPAGEAASAAVGLLPFATAADVATSDMTVCPGADLQLLASSGLEGATYTWYSDEELTQQVGTGQQLSLTDVQSPATYYVTVQNDEYCETPAGEAAIAEVSLLPTISSASVSAFLTGSNDKQVLGGKVYLTLTVEPDGIDYESLWFANGAPIASETPVQCTDMPYTDTEYMVKVNDICGTTLEAFANVQVKWPTIITPYNAEGKNDGFITDMPEIYLEIFDRWGNVVYSDYGGWAQSEAAKQQPGVYYYTAKLPDGTVRNGTLELFR